MPALTFVAPANAVRYVGAWPVFMGGSVLSLALGYRTFTHVKNLIGNVL